MTKSNLLRRFETVPERYRQTDDRHQCSIRTALYTKIRSWTSQLAYELLAPQLPVLLPFEYLALPSTAI
mgnify:CR=1 FL=1